MTNLIWIVVYIKVEYVFSRCLTQTNRYKRQQMNLSNKQMQYLKGLAHPLKPVVQLGNNGLTEGVLAEIENALGFHELIKVKVPSDDKEEKQLIMNAIIGETKAIQVQAIGHVLVMYRQSDERKISIPKR
jgi:RNA-binding protein